MHPTTVSARVPPAGQMRLLSRAETAMLLDSSQGGLYPLFRNCALAVLNTGGDTDDSRELLARYPDFSIEIVQEERGVSLDVRNAPAQAFVDGRMIRGIREHLFAVLRDIVFVASEIRHNPHFDLASSAGITDAVFHILRNAGLLHTRVESQLVVCWGGHSISREEYDYSKQVGYEFGLRGLDICTGCGPGAMKGPMKGAAVAHAKQRIVRGRYVGISEPGIIAAESPNPIVNQLVICPDIEKRLEAFVRLGHAFVVFPGGVGTAEEILYLLGVLSHPDNADIPFPLVLTGPASAAPYLRQVDAFIVATLGASARKRYRILIDEPEAVARYLQQAATAVHEHRARSNDAYCFNWQLRIDEGFQQPFVPTHDAMARLDLHRDQPPERLAMALRRAFSGIVAGNVKNEAMLAIERDGPFEIHGDRSILQPLDELLRAFVAQQRMKLAGKKYEPCYRVVV